MSELLLRVRLHKLRGEIFKNRSSLTVVTKSRKIVILGSPEKFIDHSVQWCEVIFGNIVLEDLFDEEHLWEHFRFETNRIIEGECYLYRCLYGQGGGVEFHKEDGTEGEIEKLEGGGF